MLSAQSIWSSLAELVELRSCALFLSSADRQPPEREKRFFLVAAELAVREPALRHVLGEKVGDRNRSRHGGNPADGRWTLLTLLEAMPF
jgi:hypothetical protein